MKKNKFLIYSNETTSSLKTKASLIDKLNQSGHSIATDLDDTTDLLVVIGGDGAFLEAIQKYDFPSIPIIGINTGHLGFFQEIHPDQLDQFIFNYQQGKYTIQNLSTVEVKIDDGENVHVHTGLNEVIIKGNDSHAIHLNIEIGGSFIERFSGDGIVISTPAGSTAYNYSLGGSIVDPRVKILQVTPIAPMNSTAYRAFTSSLIMPAGISIGIIPDLTDAKTPIKVLFDGCRREYNKVKNIDVTFSTKEVRLLRFENYDFWNKVKTKFL